MRRPTRPGTRSAALPTSSGGCYGPRSAIRLCSPHLMIPAWCSIGSRMYKRMPADKAQGKRSVGLCSAKVALALLLTIACSAGVAAAELAFDIKIDLGRVPDAIRLIRVTEGDVVKLRWTS